MISFRSLLTLEHSMVCADLQCRSSRNINTSTGLGLMDSRVRWRQHRTSVVLTSKRPGRVALFSHSSVIKNGPELMMTAEWFTNESCNGIRRHPADVSAVCGDDTCVAAGCRSRWGCAEIHVPLN